MKKKIFLNGPPDEETDQPRKGIRLIPRARPGAAAYSPSPAVPSRSSPKTKPQRPIVPRTEDNSVKALMMVLAAVFVVIVASVLYAASKPRALPTVPAPRLADQSSKEPERMWMKEYMEQHGPSEELKARRARMGRFQQTGSATGAN